jgi:hypothetical protein
LSMGELFAMGIFYARRVSFVQTYRLKSRAPGWLRPGAG